MPTGYTADVVNGTITELEPFALQLARGMGALITMRDESHDAPIPEKLEPSLWNAERLAEVIVERDRLYAMSEAEAEAAADAEYREDIAARDKWLSDKIAQRQRYLAMISKVEAWKSPPEGIREFALKQLHSGMDFDCPLGDTYWKPVERSTGAQWRQTKLEKVSKEIEYHATEDAKERARTDSRNAWLAQLRKSLALTASN
jgi:hypothetical protein